jgi:hypothetical protein
VGSGFVLLIELPYAMAAKMSSIAMISFDKSAEVKTAVSKQQSHFGERQNDRQSPVGGTLRSSLDNALLDNAARHPRKMVDVLKAESLQRDLQGRLSQLARASSI